MPVLNGYETTRALRADPATAGVKVVVLTASVRDSERLQALEAGADLYLRKPFGGRDLTRRIREMLAAI
jgi:CheY-like chemotaxis protein